MTESPSQIGSAYRPTEVEASVRAAWDEADVFAPDGAGSRAIPSMTPFVIIQPPPNVTGALHMGHALTAAIEDALVRHARMLGHATLWLPGVDHASIAAQVVLDRILAREGESRASLGRERYLERMWAFMDETRGTMGEQHRRLGVSVDWSRLRFTMDEGSAQAVRTAFKRLWDDGLAYRDERLINWCPGCRTSVSDLEVIGKPRTGTLWSIRYHLVREDGTPDPDAVITVATTRPETLLGDTAVAVHPDDPRYAALVGRSVLIPFTGRAVPVIADEAVEREFGTGAVKITPAHDHDDFAMGRRHDLPLIDVMTDDGRMSEQAGAYAGLTVEDARTRIVADLDAQGDLAGTQAHEMVVGRCERSDDIVEPRLKTQWFIRVAPMAAQAMAAVREGRTRFVTPKFEKQFFAWMTDIHDWNVSRQLWWGHRIPAWYCADGHVSVSDQAEGPQACATCGASELRQDDDIFDTWFSSGLWPFSTLGWPERTIDLDRYYPGTVMETGYDIIFFWVARMMMLGEWLMGREPFSTVYLHGMVRDPYGAKMSKTRGNVVDPLGVVDEVGADALRFALINGLTPGMDQRMSPSRLEGARNFANKIWNASRFVLAQRPAELPADAILAVPSTELLGPAEHWILERCRETLAAVDQAYATFQLGEAARLLHTAIWAEYCDWYLELAKTQLAPEHPAERRVATWQVLAWVLDRYLRLLHPLMPHITEHVWARLPKLPDDPDLLIVARWPAVPQGDADGAGAVAASGTAELLELITAIRNARKDAGIDASTWLAATIVPRSDALLAALRGLEDAVERLARVRVSVADDRAVLDAMTGALAVVTDQAEARLAASAADVERDRARIARELAEAEQHLEAALARLADTAFTERAPAAVVEGARQRAQELAERVARLRGHVAGPA